MRRNNIANRKKYSCRINKLWKNGVDLFVQAPPPGRTLFTYMSLLAAMYKLPHTWPHVVEMPSRK
jgi:hypothetical protein